MTDFRLFDEYRRENTTINGRNASYCDVDYLLRFWREAKNEYLMPLFPDSLIMERPIEYTRNDDELERDMDQMIQEQRPLINQLMEALFSKTHVDDSHYTHDHSDKAALVRYLCAMLQRPNGLVENALDLDDVRYYTYHWGYDSSEPFGKNIELVPGKMINLTNGQKITRLWGQVAKMLDISDLWERFRIAHSQCLNQKKLKGTLCLSIHPLDYATASDNDNGWSSCMSWREEGCYRMGTVEMMNSPMVICAYVKSDKQYLTIGNAKWNSKKWRAWILVDKNAILCNRHYPYHQEEFAKQAIQWVRDLVGEKYNWQYEDIYTDFYQHMEDVEREIRYETTYMYNDLGGSDVIGCLSIKNHAPRYINFSGPAECMVCGEEFGSGGEADRLECQACSSDYICEECGCALTEDEVSFGPNGEPLCSDCFADECAICAHCDDTIYRDNAKTLVFPVNSDLAARDLKSSPYMSKRLTSFWGRTHIPLTYGDDQVVCEHCLHKFGALEIAADAPVYGQNREHRTEVLVPNPEKASMEEVFNLTNPEGWAWATSGYAQSCRTEEAKEVIKFWTAQWESFVATMKDMKYTTIC